MGFWTITFLIGGALLILMIIFSQLNSKKRAEWFASYRSEIIELLDLDGFHANELFHGRHWLGMNYYTLIALFGRPDHVERIEMKTKSKEILIYNVVNPNTKRNTSNKYVLENHILIKVEVKAPQLTVWEKFRQENPFSETDKATIKNSLKQLQST
jgi:hypothetical protein